ncbi:MULTISPECIES: Gfo/Idh/MocA family protein [unclassified Luteococcus]|uniref:Gfo/Idh/MocA family protein n=1 Tax=unclassified Luteococcus TaxID=2639923 RepID=UPI00313EF845
MTTAVIVGCGDVAGVHFEALQALGIGLLAVVDTDPAVLARTTGRLQTLGLQVPGLGSVDDLLAAIDAGSIAWPDVVHVTTPHHQHAPVTVPLLGAGLNVIQEKPLANTLVAGQQLVEAAASAEGRLGVCFQNRYNAGNQALKKILEDGELGEILGGYASVVWTRTPDYYQAKPWRGRWDQAGGGLLINQALHTLDLLQWFLGDPTEVRGSASTLKYRGVIEVEDSAQALFTHPAHGDQPEVTSTFVGSLTNAVHRNVEVEIYGSLGTATMADGLHVRYADGRTLDVAERVVPTTGRSYWGMSHQLLIDDFHRQLGSPRPFWIGPQEAMASLRMLKAVYADTWPQAGHHQ